MKSRKVSGMAVLLILVLPVVSMLGFDFAMRKGSPDLDVLVENAVLEDGHFTMTASQGGKSGTAFRRSNYEIEDDRLYVTLFSGLVYGGFRQDSLRVDIQDGGLCGVRQVYLRNGSVSKLIYSR